MNKPASFTCPFCLKRHDFSTTLICPETDYKIPKEFLEHESLWLVTVGFSGHGKTVYLTALTLALQEIGAVLEDVTMDYLDAETKDEVRRMRYDVMEGDMPPPTPREELNRPLLMLKLAKLPGIGTRNVVIFDVAGELFTRFDEIHKYIAALKHVKTIWFFISLTDLYNPKSLDTMADLFGTYRKGMDRLDASLKGRNMIVVYTKADTRNFGPEIDVYLQNDPLAELTNRNAERLPTTDDFDWKTYAEDIKNISQKLRVYTETQLRGGRQFISSAKNEGMRVEFCVTSALGTNPDRDTNKMLEDSTRFRVVDPFIWTVLLESEIGSVRGAETTKGHVTLILDSSTESGKIYEEKLPVQLGTMLTSFDFEVRSFYLGQSKIVTHWGQTPPDSPARHSTRPRLAGAIFDQLSAGTDKVVIMTSRLPDDLNDYRTTLWKERTLLVSMNELDTDWEQFTYRNSSDLQPLVNLIKRMSTTNSHSTQS